MALFPLFPVASSVSAPTIIDPMLKFETDQRYSVRRALSSRPRRRFTVEWLGKTTYEMRTIRDFLMQCRLGASVFSWQHTMSVDLASFLSTTPVILAGYWHGLYTGQWVIVTQASIPAIEGIWQVTRIDATQIALNGSSAVGAGTCMALPYLPTAVGIFDQDEWQSPTKLIGPEGNYPRMGYFNFVLQIEEVF